MTVPVCRKCGFGPRATVEFRHSPKGGYLCREALACKLRLRALKKAAA